MQVLNHTIEVTPDEIEILGEALCTFIRQSFKGFGDATTANMNFLIEEEENLLRQLTYAGFTLWLTPDGTTEQHGKVTIEVEKWIENEKKLALAETLKSSV